MGKDGKNQFYRTLSLDEETRKILKWYKGIVKKMQQEPDEKRGEN
jgi:hypothetical protein